MSRIKQAYVAPSIAFFKQEFLNKHNLENYHDNNAPALFFGAYEGSNLINNHKNYKLVLPSTPHDVPLIKNYNMVLMACSDNYPLPKSVIRKSITPRIKDYSKFYPTVLGDKIYFYSGFKNGWNIFDSPLIKHIQKQIKWEIITTSHSNLRDYYSIESLLSNFYQKSFLNLNFSEGNGLATGIELGLMGRKTIFNPKLKHNIQRLEFPNFINYQTTEDIINIINEESKKIGTVQPSIDAHNVGDEWLNLDFWLC